VILVQFFEMTVELFGSCSKIMKRQKDSLSKPLEKQLNKHFSQGIHSWF